MPNALRSLRALPCDDPNDDSLASALLAIAPDPDSNRIISAHAFLRDFSRYLISAAMARGERGITIYDVFVPPDQAFFLENPACPARYVGERDLMSEAGAETLAFMNRAAGVAWAALADSQPAGLYIKTISGLFDLYMEARDTDQLGLAEWMAHRKTYVSMIAPIAFFVWPDHWSARDFLRQASLENLIQMASTEGFVSNTIEPIILPRAMRRRILYYLAHVGKYTGAGAFYQADGMAGNEDTVTIPDVVRSFHAIVLSGVVVIPTAAII